MTTGAWVLLVIAAGFAVGNWISRIHPPPPGSISRLEYVCKPGTLLALIGVALLVDPTHPDERTWFVVALVLSLAGDVFLMLPDDRFVAGLASFLLAHVAYVVGLNLHTDGNWWWAVPVILAVGLLGVRLVRGIRRSGESELVAPVVVYVVVIAAMGISALASGNRWAAVGAVLFMGSDALIGETRFVRPAAWAPVAIMVTYHLGQAGLVLSLVWS
ncbi:MAG: lysoplasmalogenase [Acidimicrobiia bacterium]